MLALGRLVDTRTNNKILIQPATLAQRLLKKKQFKLTNFNKVVTMSKSESKVTINTGNVLNLIDIKKKAGQNVTEEVSRLSFI